MSAQVSYSIWSNFTTQRSLQRAFDAAVNDGCFVVIKGRTLGGMYPSKGEDPISESYDPSNVRMVFRQARDGDVSVATLDLVGLKPRDIPNIIEQYGAGHSSPVVTIRSGERSCVVAANIGVGESLDKVSYANFRVALVMASCNERGLNA